MHEPINFIDEQQTEVIEYSEMFIRQLMEKVTILNEKRIIIFKPSMEVEVVT